MLDPSQLPFRVEQARERAGSAGDRLQPPPNPHTRALRATQVPPRSGDGPGQRDRGAAAAGSAQPARLRDSGRRYASEGAGRGRATPKGTAGERRASGPRRGPVNARRVARRGAAPSTGPPHVRWHGRGGAPAPPSAPAATARFRSLKLRHCGLAGRRPSPAPPSSRPAAPAIFWGRHTCPGGEDGGAHHTHKTWLPFKTKTSRAAARRWHSPEDHMVTENSPSRVLICTCFCSHFLLPGSAPPPPAAPAPLPR